MNITPRGTSTVLTLAGALPFLLLMLAPETVGGLNTASLFASYGAIISSFMAGTLWGRAQSRQAGVGAIVASNVLALVSFATLVCTELPVSLVVQWVVFILLLIADHSMLVGAHELRWYWRLRVAVTSVVSFAYAVLLLRHILSIGV